MDASTVREDRWTSQAAFRWGIAGTLLLTLATGVVSVIELQRTRHEVRHLALDADRSTYLVGEVGRQATRLRVEVLQSMVGPAAADLDQRLAQINVQLDGALRELEPLLQEEERARWDVVLPQLARLRSALERAVAALDGGRVEEARTLLERDAAALAVPMQEDLDRLTALNQRESRLLLEAADRRLRHVRRIETGLTVGLALGLGLIWWAVVHTVTRQRRALTEYTTRIESTNRDLDAFAGRIAHDLRNALSPLATMAGTLRRSEGRRIEPIANHLEKAVGRSTGLIDGLLAFSRAGRARETDAVANVRRVVEDVVEEVAPAAASTGTAVELGVEDVSVGCPPELLRIVVGNLVGNALKFCAGRPVRRVVVKTETADGWCTLDVEDSGPGIPAGSMRKIFDPFYRVPGVTAPGTGIGLATVHRIVEAHRGTIEVVSPPGAGARFRVRLPVRNVPVGVELRSAER